MEMLHNTRNTKKQSLWTTLDQALVKAQPTKDSRRKSLERRQWPAASRVMTILSVMRLNTTKAEVSQTEKVLPTQLRRRVMSIIARRYQVSKVLNQHGMASVVRTTKSTSSTRVTRSENKISHKLTTDKLSVLKAGSRSKGSRKELYREEPKDSSV